MINLPTGPTAQARSRRALLVTAAIPNCIVAWLLVSVTMPNLRLVGLGFVPVAMILMTGNRASVTAFAKALGVEDRPNLVNQFSPRYVGYYAAGAQWPECRVCSSK